MTRVALLLIFISGCANQVAGTRQIQAPKVEHPAKHVVQARCVEKKPTTAPILRCDIRSVNVRCWRG